MNIFVLDKDPIKAAKYMCDKHVPKMLLESAQLLCNAFDIETPYRKTHTNHPCSKWVRDGYYNFCWLVLHATQLHDEFRSRFGKEHKSWEVVKWCWYNRKKHPRYHDRDVSQLHNFTLAMPEQYKSEDPVQSYRDYYQAEKVSFAKWRFGKPYWWEG